MFAKRGLIVLTALLLCAATLGARPAGAATNAIGGSNSADTIVGSLGDDFMFGKGGPDKVRGRDGDDNIFGGGGADRLDGGPGDDNLVDDDGTGGDVLLGRSGDDTLYSLDGSTAGSPDILNCGADGGTAYADPGDKVNGCGRVIRRSTTFQGFRIRVAGNGNSFLDEPNDPTKSFGRNGNDIIRGSRFADEIFISAGRDIIQGFEGDDVFVDDDTQPSDAIQPGEGADTTYMADGQPGSIDCDVNKHDNGSDDIVFADPNDSVFHCGTVFRV